MNEGQDLLSYLNKKVKVALLMGFISLCTFEILQTYQYSKSTQVELNKAITLQVLGLLNEKANIGDILSIQRDLEKIISPLANLSSIKIFVTESKSQKQIATIKIGSSFFTNFTSSENLQTLNTPAGDFSVSILLSNDQLLFEIIKRTLLTLLIFAITVFFINRVVRQSIKSEISIADSLLKHISNFNFEKYTDEAFEIEASTEIKSLSSAWRNFYIQISMMNKQFLIAKTSEMKGVIAAQFAHDIRSPLMTLNIAAEQFDYNPKEAHQLLSLSIARINDIANDLLNLEKKDNSSEKVNIYEKIEEILLEKRIEFKGNIEIKLSNSNAEAFIPIVQINNSDFKRMVSNLLNNAFEAQATSISLELYCSDIYVCLKIIDNGIGMSEEVVERLGERGFSTGKKEGKSGTGLGFHHAMKTIEDLGGKISVKSRLGEGTTIEIIFLLSKT